MKKLMVLLAAAMLALGAQAQILWRVSGNGLTKDSYVLGTYHIATTSVLDTLKGFNAAFDGADIVVGELVTDSMKSQPTLARIAQAMIAPADSTLDKLYSPDGLAIISRVWDRYFGALGVGLDKVYQLKPIGISTQLSVMQAITQFPNYNPNEAMDDAVQQRAKQAGKAVGGLETSDEQIALLFNCPITEQSADLLEMCKNDSLFVTYSNEIADDYKTQKIDAMLQLMLDNEVEGSSTNWDRILFNRNKVWAEKLPAIMDGKSVLVCVGCGHLPGDKGLLALLRKAGYTVTPVWN